MKNKIMKHKIIPKEWNLFKSVNIFIFFSSGDIFIQSETSFQEP